MPDAKPYIRPSRNASLSPDDSEEYPTPGWEMMIDELAIWTDKISESSRFAVALISFHP